jgi:hypothetical protein
MRRLILLVCLAAMCGAAVLPATTGTAGAVVTPTSRCKDIIRKFHYGSPFRLFRQATGCLLLLDRLKNGAAGMAGNAALNSSSGAHARAIGGSALLGPQKRPGQPPRSRHSGPRRPQSAPNARQPADNARIRGAGYCAGGRATPTPRSPTRAAASPAPRPTTPSSSGSPTRPTG